MDFAGSNSQQMPSDNQMMHQVKAELDAAYAQEFYNVCLSHGFPPPPPSRDLRLQPRPAWLRKNPLTPTRAAPRRATDSF